MHSAVAVMYRASRDRPGDANGNEQNGNGEGSTPTSHDLSVAGPGHLGPRVGSRDAADACVTGVTLRRDLEDPTG